MDAFKHVYVPSAASRSRHERTTAEVGNMISLTRLCQMPRPERAVKLPCRSMQNKRVIPTLVSSKVRVCHFTLRTSHSQVLLTHVKTAHEVGTNIRLHTTLAFRDNNRCLHAITPIVARQMCANAAAQIVANPSAVGTDDDGTPVIRVSKFMPRPEDMRLKVHILRHSN